MDGLEGSASLRTPEGPPGAPGDSQPGGVFSWGSAAGAAKQSAGEAAEAKTELARVVREAVALQLPEEAAVAGCPYPLSLRLHATYLLTLGADPFSLEAFFALPLKMGGAYWASTALWLLGLKSRKSQRLLAQAAWGGPHPVEAQQQQAEAPPEADGGISSAPNNIGALSLDSVLQSREDALSTWVLSCLQPCGGFGHERQQDAHLTATHYALLLLAGLGRLHLLPCPEETACWVRSLQGADGGFKGDEWGEVDSRFCYCGVGSLLLLGRLDDATAAKAVGFVRRLLNADGGFAWVPGGESHAASAFCCLGTLAICGGLWAVDRQQLARWLAERQTPAGGFNGRPEKAPDVCYSFWIFSSLQILGYGCWIDQHKLCRFILEAQDPEAGGIADRPGDVADPFHTFFGLAALGMLKASDALEQLHPVLALPLSVVRQLRLPKCTIC